MLLQYLGSNVMKTQYAFSLTVHSAQNFGQYRVNRRITVGKYLKEVYHDEFQIDLRREAELLMTSLITPWSSTADEWIPRCADSATYQLIYNTIMSDEERVALDTILLEEPELAAAKYPYALTLNALNTLYAPDAERTHAAVFDTRAETVAAPPPSAPSSEAVSRAGALAKNAREAAEAHACASALAGHTSESDDFIDVGLAIGKLPEGSAKSVVKALGLGDVLQGVEVSALLV